MRGEEEKSGEQRPRSFTSRAPTTAANTEAAALASMPESRSVLVVGAGYKYVSREQIELDTIKF